MKLDISKINFSKYDTKRVLNLPYEMSESLAEDIGIMIGDGHIGLNKWKSTAEYSICISGNSISDKDYIINYVKPLKFKLYNLDFSVLFVGENKTEVRLKLCSKGLVEFYNKVIGLPVNKKQNIGIPKCIFWKERYIASCLRGIMDTDFGLSFKKKEKYPVLQLKTSSRKLVEDCKKGFYKLGVKTNAYLNRTEIHSITKRPFITNYLFINGRSNLIKCIEKIGFNNKRMINKIKQNMGPRGNS